MKKGKDMWQVLCYPGIPGNYLSQMGKFSEQWKCVLLGSKHFHMAFSNPHPKSDGNGGRMIN